MSDKEVLLAVFDDEASADTAAKNLETWSKADDQVKVNSMGVLVMDEKGKVKTHKLGPRSTGKGAGIGLVLAMLTPVGLGVGVIGGGLLGRLRRKGIGVGDEDLEHYRDELKQGHAVVGVVVPPSDAQVVMEKLTAEGGRLEAYETTDADLQEATKEGA